MLASFIVWEAFIRGSVYDGFNVEAHAAHRRMANAIIIVWDLVPGKIWYIYVVAVADAGYLVTQDDHQGFLRHHAMAPIVFF